MYKRLILGMGSIVAIVSPVLVSVSCSHDDGYLHGYVNINSSEFIRGDWYTFEKEVQRGYGSIDGTMERGIKLTLMLDGKRFGDDLVLEANEFRSTIPGYDRVQLGSTGVREKEDWTENIFNQLNPVLPLSDLPMDSARQTIVDIGMEFYRHNESKFINFISDTDLMINETMATFLNENAPVKTNIRYDYNSEYTETVMTVEPNTYLRVFSILPETSAYSLLISPDDDNRITDIKYGSKNNFDTIQSCTEEDIIALAYDQSGNYVGHTILTREQFNSQFPNVQIS